MHEIITMGKTKTSYKKFVISNIFLTQILKSMNSSDSI